MTPELSEAIILAVSLLNTMLLLWLGTRYSA